MSAASLLSHQSTGSALSHQSNGSVLSSQADHALRGRRTRGRVPAGAVSTSVLIGLAAIVLHRAGRDHHHPLRRASSAASTLLLLHRQPRVSARGSAAR
jgi:hypothetical protein